MATIGFIVVSIVLVCFMVYVRSETNDLEQKNIELTKKLNKVYTELFYNDLQINVFTGETRGEEISKLKQLTKDSAESEKNILNKFKKLEDYLDIEYVKLETKVEKYEKKQYLSGGFFAVSGGTPTAEWSEVCTKKVAKKSKSKKK